MGRPAIDETGSRYGRLTVIRRRGTKNPVDRKFALGFGRTFTDREQVDDLLGLIF